MEPLGPSKVRNDFTDHFVGMLSQERILGAEEKRAPLANVHGYWQYVLV